MRQVIVTALALAVLAWYASHRKRLVRARQYAHEEMERWENEGGASPDEQRQPTRGGGVSGSM
jgi:hypothetical protein